MWAGSLLLRIGEQRDLLVAVHADTDAALERLRTLFEPWLESAPPEGLADLAPVFSLRLEPVDGRPERGAGPRHVPQLRYGTAVMVRSREPDDILRAFGQVLGGAHRYRRDDGLVWIGMRPFVRGSSMVLVDVDRPTMVNDRLLARSGVEELAVWSTIVEPDGTVTVPAPLPDLAWDAAGVEPPSEGPRSFQLAGIATLHDHECTPSELAADLGRRSIQARWFTLVASMTEAGMLMSATDRSALRDRVRMLLGAFRACIAPLLALDVVAAGVTDTAEQALDESPPRPIPCQRT